MGEFAGEHRLFGGSGVGERRAAAGLGRRFPGGDGAFRMCRTHPDRHESRHSVVNYGFFEEWDPAGGVLTTWTATPQSREAARRAPAHPTAPSYQQEVYLRAAHRETGKGFRASRLCMISFDLPGKPDHRAMTRTVNAFLRRHDTFAGRFVRRADGSFARHRIDVRSIEFQPVRHGEVAGSAAVRAHVQRETPGPFDWDCFTFGIIERADAFTVYAAVDHLHTDGVAQALTFVDLLTIYSAESGGRAPVLPAVTGHIAYCARDRRVNEGLGRASAGVRAWRNILYRHGGEIPGFPVDTGSERGGYTRGAQVTATLLPEERAVEFDELCAKQGGRFLAGIFAAAACVERELAGRSRYLGLTPVNTRHEAGEAASVGWYTNLVPVSFPVGAADSFASLVGSAQRAMDRSRELSDISLHRVLELAADDPNITAAPGCSTPMLSYLDIRRISGAALFTAVNGGIYANPISPREVYIWVNRFADATRITLLFPDTAVARESVTRYLTAFRRVVDTVCATGDYGLAVEAVP
ncbi:condensation domain-containing protein [Nocardia sp. CA-290969]|uniref:condensation domain-containing protein n=1 Tax=Nocardia sp. CA-290969 TaxID=3239986 RepID=UPI003D8F6033